MSDGLRKIRERLEQTRKETGVHTIFLVYKRGTRNIVATIGPEEVPQYMTPEHTVVVTASRVLWPTKHPEQLLQNYRWDDGDALN